MKVRWWIKSADQPDRASPELLTLVKMRAQRSRKECAAHFGVTPNRITQVLDRYARWRNHPNRKEEEEA